MKNLLDLKAAVHNLSALKYRKHDRSSHVKSILHCCCWEIVNNRPGNINVKISLTLNILIKNFTEFSFK